MNRFGVQGQRTLDSIRHPYAYVLGSEKIRLMVRKMKNEILGSAYSTAKTLQTELCLIKIGQSSQDTIV